MKKHISVRIFFYILLVFTLLIFYKTFFSNNNYEKNQIITQIKFENLLDPNNQNKQEIINLNDIRIFLKDQYLLLSEVADPYARNALKFDNYNEFQTKISILSDGIIITSYIDIGFQEKKIMEYHKKIIDKYNKTYTHPQLITNRIKIKVDHYDFKKVFKFDYSLFLILIITIDILFFSYFRRYLI